MNTSVAPNRALYILCAEDEPDLLDLYASLIGPMGYSVLLAKDGNEALALVEKHGPRIVLVVSDFMMPGKNGFELREAMLATYRAIPFIIISGNITREAAMEAVELKISAFLEKPFTEAKFRELVEKESLERITSIKDDDEMLDGFIVEAQALTEEMEEHILTLEGNSNDAEAVNRIFACAHTIKGASGFFEPDDVHQFTHRYEDFLATFKKDPDSLTQGGISTLLKGLDTIKILLSCLAQGQKSAVALEELKKIFDEKVEVEEKTDVSAGADKSSGSHQTAQKKTEELRVGVDILNDFMERSGEITVLRNMMNKVIRVIEIEHEADRNVTSLTELLSEMHKVVSSMQDQIGDLRKIPLRQVFKPLGRALRDLCAGLKKKIDLEIQGEEIRIDHTLAEVLNKCLIHMVRNSADHGVEMPADRLKSGKPEAGTIRIQVRESSEEIVLILSDDGRGINSEKVKQKAVEKNLISVETARTMSDSAARMLIFEPGFSTAEEITGVSGRGVGTDMVKQTIAGLGGRIELHSTLGQGTEFVLTLPVPKSVLIIPSLIVRVNDELFAVPQESVVRVAELGVVERERNLRKVGERLVYQQENALLPVLSLRQVLGLQDHDVDVTRDLTLLCLEGLHAPYCLVVDEVLDMEDIVVKPVGNWVSDIEIYAGATFMADGRIGLIIDGEGVAKRAGFSGVGEIKPETVEVAQSAAQRSLFLFQIGAGENYAIPQEELFRLERIESSKLQYSGQQAMSVFRGRAMPIFDLEQVLCAVSGRPKFTDESLLTMVIEHGNQFYGFVVPKFNDFESDSGARGVVLSPLQETLVLNERTVTLISLKEWISAGRVTQYPKSDYGLTG
jgi:two-component system chemotaxis sensor kinase CheA